MSTILLRRPPDKSSEGSTRLRARKVCAANNQYHSQNEDNDDCKAHKFQDSNLSGVGFAGILGDM